MCVGSGRSREREKNDKLYCLKNKKNVNVNALFFNAQLEKKQGEGR